MKDFRNGISYYTQGTVTINFPEDDICCQHCHLMGVELKSDRRYCRRTGEYLPGYLATIGLDCPIKFGGNDNGEYADL